MSPLACDLSPVTPPPEASPQARERAAGSFRPEQPKGEPRVAPTNERQLHRFDCEGCAPADVVAEPPSVPDDGAPHPEAEDSDAQVASSGVVETRPTDVPPPVHASPSPDADDGALPKDDLPAADAAPSPAALWDGRGERP